MKKHKSIVKRESKIVFKKNLVIKTLRRESWSKENFDLYKQYSSRNNYAVKLIEWIDEKTFSMEYIDIDQSVSTLIEDQYNLSEEFKRDFLILYTRIYTECLLFSKQNLPAGSYFMHKDMNLANFVLDKQGNIKLLDPNSFTIQNNPINESYAFRSQQLLWNLMKTYSR